MAWKNSSVEVIEMASGCRLAARRLVPDDESGHCHVLEGKAVGRLVKKGESKALDEGRAFLLRLKNGQRGRPQERIILPPKPASRTSSVRRAAGALRRTSGGGESKTRPKEMAPRQDLAGQISDLKSQLTQAFEAIVKLNRKVQAVQANQTDRTDKSDLDAKVTRLEAMVEAMRSTWRVQHGYTPHHPELPPLSQRTLPITTEERS